MIATCLSLSLHLEPRDNMAIVDKMDIFCRHSPINLSKKREEKKKKRKKEKKKGEEKE